MLRRSRPGPSGIRGGHPRGATPINELLRSIQLHGFRRPGLAALLALAGALGAAPSAGESADTAVELTLPLRAAWHIDAGQLTLSSWRAPLRDQALVLPATGAVEAREARTGSLIWRSPLGSLSPRTATFLGDLVLTGGVAPAGEPDLVALDEESGAARYALRLGGVFAAPIAAGSGFVAASTHALAAFDTLGNKRWQVDFPRTPDGHPGGPGLSRPALLGDLVLTGAADSRLHAFTLVEGRAVWSAPLPRRLLSAVATDGELAIVTTFGAIIAFDAGGNERWRRAIDGDPAYAGPAIAAGVVYVSTGTGGDVLALEASTGQLIWRNELGVECFSQPALTRDHVVVGDLANRLLVLDRESGRTAGTWQLTGAGGVFLADPVVADSLVGVGTANGIFEVLVSAPEPSPPAAGGSLLAAPNPFTDRVQIIASGAGADRGAELLVVDVSGRLRRRIHVPAGTTPSWDGQDDSGRALAAGIYFLRLTDGARTWCGKVELGR
jgi:outer membrane protein assembly factor BamB